MDKVSNMLKEIVNNTKFNPFKDVAFLLDKTEQSIRNKYSLDNFTFREIMMILDLCNYHVDFVPNDANLYVYELDPDEYLSDEDKDALKRLKDQQIEGQMTIFDCFVNDIPDNVKDDVIDQMIKKLESKKSNG